MSYSAVRRVAITDAFFAIDGLFETFLTVLDEFGAYPAVIGRELDRYLPFLATTKFLMALVKAGVGREVAHEIVKEHAVAAALAMRSNEGDSDVVSRLAADERVPLGEAELRAALGSPLSFIGAARQQVESFVARVTELVEQHREAASYTPGEIL